MSKLRFLFFAWIMPEVSSGLVVCLWLFLFGHGVERLVVIVMTIMKSAVAEWEWQ